MVVTQMAKKLTPKQTKFVEEYARNGGNGTQAAMKAYNVKDESVAKVVASENLTKPNIRTITEQLFSLEKTEDIVKNLHKLATQSQDEKIQVDATKEWLSHAVPKQEGGNTLNNFGQLLIQQKDKYED